MSAVEHKHPGYCVSSKGDLREHERVQGAPTAVRFHHFVCSPSTCAPRTRSRDVHHFVPPRSRPTRPASRHGLLGPRAQRGRPRRARPRRPPVLDGLPPRASPRLDGRPRTTLATRRGRPSSSRLRAGDTDVDGWGCDTYMLTGDNFSYALGAKGSTRRKLAAASGCINDYVGKLACFARPRRRKVPAPRARRRAPRRRSATRRTAAAARTTSAGSSSSARRPRPYCGSTSTPDLILNEVPRDSPPRASPRAPDGRARTLARRQ